MSLLDSTSGQQSRDIRGLLQQIEAEIQRTETANRAILNASQNPQDKANLLRRFDLNFPPNFLSQRISADAPQRIIAAQQRITSFISTTGGLDASQRQLLEALSARIGDISSHFLNYNENFNPAVVLNLSNLPLWFYQLSSAPDFDAMANNQTEIDRAFGVYLDRLRSARSTVSQLITEANAAASPERRFSTIMNVIQGTVAVIRDARTEVERNRIEARRMSEENEKIIAETALNIFSSRIGESSYLYLLFIFGVVFFLVLSLPVLYSKFDSPVARQILTSGFILQFSTVFILVSSIIILGIGGFIKEDHLPALLAAISGYVLGQLGQIRQATEPPPNFASTSSTNEQTKP